MEVREHSTSFKLMVSWAALWVTIGSDDGKDKEDRVGTKTGRNDKNRQETTRQGEKR